MNKLKIIVSISFLIIITGCTAKPAPASSAVPTAKASTPIETTIPSSSISTALKTYTNSNFGISFKYPPNYGEPTVLNNELISFISPLASRGPKEQEGLKSTELKVEIYIKPLKSGDTLAGFVQEINQQQETTVLTKKDLPINNLKYHYQRVRGLGEVDNYFTITKKYRVIIAKYPAETLREYEFESMLNSLTFKD